MRRRALAWVALGLLVVLVVGIPLLRAGRHRFAAPTRIRDGVWGVHGQVSDFFGARADGKVILFDTGADPAGGALDALLKALGATRDDVSDVFLTHGHGDHVAAAPLLKKARLHGGIGDSDMMAQRGPVVPWLARLMSFILPVPPVMLTDAFLDKASVAVAGGQAVQAFPFPGHTPGSMVYLYDDVLFAGDSMNYRGGKLEPAFGPFSVDERANRASIAALPTTLTLAEVKVVCTAHGGCTPEADTQRLLKDLIEKARSR